MKSKEDHLKSSVAPLLWAVNIAAVVVLMDLTAVNIALPSISRYFESGMKLVSWILLVSMLTASSSAFIAGKLTEIISSPKILLSAFAVFLATTTLCFFSKDLYIILPARFIQGFAESILYVSGPALIRQHLPTTRQQKAYGIWMMSCGIGISIGPVIGGALTSMLSWQWVFFINIPLCVAGIVFTFFIRNGSKQDAFKSDSSFDYYGAVLSFLFLAFIILGINGITRKTSSVLYSLAFISISVVIFVLFIRRETSFEKPVFQIRLFRNFNFMMANIGFFLFFIVNVGSRFLRPFYFENGRGLSTMTSGFLMMTAPLVMVLVSPLASMLTKRISLKAACFSGSFLLLVSMIFFSFWNKDTNIFLLVLPMIILGAGMGIYYPTASYVGMTDLPSGSHGMGSAAISTSKSLAKLFGVLMYSVLFTYFLQSSEIETVTESVRAYQYTFFAGAVLAAILTILMLTLKSDRK